MEHELFHMHIGGHREPKKLNNHNHLIYPSFNFKQLQMIKQRKSELTLDDERIFRSE